MLLLNEVLAERNKEQNTQYAAKQRTDKHLHEVHGHLGVLRLQDVKCRQCKDGTCDNNTGACTDRLDNHILAESALALCESRHTYCNDCNGNSSLEHLTHLKTKISRCCREEHRHEDTPRHRPEVDLGVLLVRRHQGLVLLTLVQRTERVFRQSRRFFIFLFHFIYCLFYHLMILCKNNENRLNTDYYKRIIKKCIHLSIITYNSRMSYTAQQKHSVLHKKHTFLCNTEYLLNKNTK